MTELAQFLLALIWWVIITALAVSLLVVLMFLFVAARDAIHRRLMPRLAVRHVDEELEQLVASRRRIA